MLVITYDNRSGIEVCESDLEEIEDVMLRTLLHQEISFECEVSFSFVNADEIKALNTKFRENESVTDVLSFPMIEALHDNLDELTGNALDFPMLLGDIVICVERAQEQAKEYHHSLTRELSYLAVHSMLHLMGYDHMEEAEKASMRSIEKEIMGDD